MTKPIKLMQFVTNSLSQISLHQKYLKTKSHFSGPSFCPEMQGDAKFHGPYPHGCMRRGPQNSSMQKYLLRAFLYDKHDKDSCILWHSVKFRFSP